MDDINEQKERNELISTNYIGKFVLDNNRIYFDCSPNKSEKMSVICMTKCPKCDKMHENISWCYSDKEEKIVDRSCFKKLMKQLDAINKAQNRFNSERQTKIVKDTEKPTDNMKIVEPTNIIDIFSYDSDEGSFSFETESESSSILLEEWDRPDGSPLTVSSEEDYVDLDEVSHVRIFGSLRDCGKIHSDCKSEEDLTVNQRKFSLVRSVKSFTSASDLGIESITIEQKVKEKRAQEKMLFRHRASIDVHKLKETEMIILSDASDDEYNYIVKKRKKSRGNSFAMQQIKILCQEIEELERKLEQKKMELQKFQRDSNLYGMP